MLSEKVVYRICPHDLDKWYIEVAVETTTIKEESFRRSAWSGVQTLHFPQTSISPWREAYQMGTIHVNDVGMEKVEWLPILIGVFRGNPPYMPLNSASRLYFNTKEECKQVIDAVLEKEKAARTKAEQIAQRLIDNPPERYP